MRSRREEVWCILPKPSEVAGAGVSAEVLAYAWEGGSVWSSVARGTSAAGVAERAGGATVADEAERGRRRDSRSRVGERRAAR
jgi:hypothetical protein